MARPSGHTNGCRSPSTALLTRPEPVLSLVYHGAVLGVCLYTQYWITSIAPLSMLCVMFTVWTGMVQGVYYALYMLASLLSYTHTTLAVKVTIAVRRCLSLLLSAMSLCSLGTTLVFWLVYLYDSALMIPPSFVYDWRLNQLQHTLPLLLSLAELLAFPHCEMPRRWDFAATMAVPVCYLAMLFYLTQSHKLPYIFMQRYFKLWHLGVFTAVMLALAWQVYSVYARVRHWRWQSAKHQQSKAQ